MKRCYIKKIILCLVVFFLSAEIFAESKSFYSNASKETQALIKKADGLVAKGQYCSALSCFENIPDNEYTIYKKNEILIENYIQTEDFVKFYLKDLKKGETLDELRVNCTQELTAYDFDVEKIIIEYESNNGSSFVLNLALANNYYSFLSCYGSYLEDYAEDLTEAIYENYVSAFENGCFDNKSLYYYGCFLTENKRYADAEKVFASLTELDKKNESVWYGYAVALYYQGKFETAADSVKTSIKLSSNSKDNAYILNKNVLLADIYFNDGKYSEAENVLIKAMKKYPQSEYLLPFLGEIYLLQGKTENAGNAFNQYIENFHQSDDVLETIVNVCRYNSYDDFLIELLEENCEKFSDDFYFSAACYETLHFIYMEKHDFNKAEYALNKSEEFYLKVPDIQGVEEFFSELRSNFQQTVESASE